MKHITILFLTCLSIMAQPPLPPWPKGLGPPPIPAGLVIIQPSNIVQNATIKVARTPAFKVTCPHCKIQLVRYHALAVQTNGSRSIAGGFMVERTIHFVCPSADCAQQFTARNEKFVPEVIAVEEDTP